MGYDVNFGVRRKKTTTCSEVSMPNLRDFKFDENGVIKAIVIAEPGKGKSTLAGTFPRPNFFDFDLKIGVLRNPRFLRLYGPKSIEYKQFPEPAIRDYRAVPSAFDAACRYFDEWMVPGKVSQFDTWVIDSGTLLSMIARAKALYVMGKSFIGSKPRSQTLERAQQSGLALMEQSDWGAERSLVEQFCRMILESGKNVIINVHEKEIVKDGVTRTVPLFTGDSKVVIPAMVPDVWHLRDGVQNGKPCLKLVASPTGTYQIRSELGLDEVYDPDYDKIVARIRELQRQANAAGGIPVAAPQGAKVPA